MKILALYALTILFIGSFLFFAWPTPFVLVNSGPTVCRINRFTGKQEIPTEHGWESYSSPLNKLLLDKSDNGEESIAKRVSAAAKLIGQPKKYDKEIGKIVVFNPTSWKLSCDRDDENCTIELFRLEKGQDVYVGSMDTAFTALKNDGYTESAYKTDLFSHDLPAGKRSVQYREVIKLKFNRVANDKESVALQELKEPVIIRIERKWTVGYANK